MYTSKSYKPDENDDCIFLNESSKIEPCWGDVTPDEDDEDELIYVCKGHEFRFYNVYYKQYVIEERI